MGRRALTLGPLRERNFRLLAGARTVSFFGTNLAPIAVAFAVLDLTGSATDTGIAFACWTLAQVATLLVGGVVADRLPRRLVMVGSDTANFAIRLLMGLLLVGGHAHVWEIFVLQALGGAAAAFYSPASSGLVAETVPPPLLQQANGVMSIARYIAFPVGAAAGGAIVATIGSGWALLLDAATYALSAALLLRISLPGRARTAAAPNFVRELREGWDAFAEHTWVWLLTAWISLYFLITYAPFFVLGPYIAKHHLNGAAGWAVVVTGEGIGALVGGIAGVRVRPKRTMTTIGAVFAVTSIQSVLLAAHAPVVAIAFAAALAGFAFSYGSVIFETSLQHTIAPEKLARVSAYDWMVSMAFLPAGYAIAGPVADVTGMSTLLVAGAVWIVLSTAAVLSVREVRAFRLDDVAPQAAPAAVPTA